MFSTISLYHFLFLFFCSGCCIFRRTLYELLLFDHCRFYKVEVFYVQTNWSVHLNWMWQLFGCRQVNVSSSKRKKTSSYNVFFFAFVCIYFAFSYMPHLFICASCSIVLMEMRFGTCTSTPNMIQFQKFSISSILFCDVELHDLTITTSSQQPFPCPKTCSIPEWTNVEFATKYLIHVIKMGDLCYLTHSWN